MEVHHHSHTARKKWTHYFWEFLMLFLAVFCGFLAEYQLEHKIEKERARELAKSLYHEVLADSAVMETVIAARLIKEKSYESFARFAKDSNLTNPGLDFYKDFTIAFVNHRAYIFEPKTEILDQLISSGSLRYFKSQELEKNISSFRVAVKKIQSRVEREVTFLDHTLRPFQIRHFDNFWLNQISDFGKITIADAILKDLSVYPRPRILHLDQFDRDEAVNTSLQGLIMSGGTRLILFKEYLEASQQLLSTLRNEYKIN